jgi:hypothetical protein
MTEQIEQTAVHVSTGPQPMPDRPAQEAPARPKSHLTRWLLLLAALGIAAGATAYWLDSRHYEDTDDAQVDGGVRREGLSDHRTGLAQLRLVRHSREGGWRSFPGSAQADAAALLADRFKLALHHDTKELAMYALVEGREEPKFHAGRPDGESSVDIAGGAMVFRNYSMSKLANYLSARAADHPVTDTTGLSGLFDFTVQLADGPSANPVDVKLALGQAMRDGTLAKLVAEQLGLKLESRKGPVPILVIDHAEKASEN